MKKQNVARRTLCLFAAAAMAVSAYAQSATSLRGTITDPQGGIIPDATVSLNNLENGAKRQVLTNAVGEYQFPQVAPGSYQLVVEKPGFSTVTRNGVKLLVNT